MTDFLDKDDPDRVYYRDNPNAGLPFTEKGTAIHEGRICARCSVEFDGAHGSPVLCHTCHDAMQGGLYNLTKAWLEEKAK